MHLRNLAAALAASILLGACGGGADPDPTPGPDSGDNALEILAEPQWSGVLAKNGPGTGTGTLIMVGDTSGGTQLRGALGFALDQIPMGAQIESATLIVYQLPLTPAGTPYSDLGSLLVHQTDFGPAIDDTDFDGGIRDLGVLSTQPGEGVRSLDVTEAVLSVLGFHPRVDFRLQFEVPTDMDGQPDLVYFNDATDQAQNGMVPMLVVKLAE